MSMLKYKNSIYRIVRRKGVSRTIAIGAVIVLILIVTGGVLYYLYVLSPQAPTTKEVVYGYVGPLSGSTSVVGQAYQKGFIWAVNYINDHGGLNGVHIRYVTADDQGDPATAKNLALSLVQTDGAAIVFGGYGSTVRPIQDAANQNQFVFVNTGDPSVSTTHASNNLNGYGFYAAVNSNNEANTTVRYALSLGVKTVALLGTSGLGALGSYTFGATLNDSKALGLQVVYQVTNPSGTSDYTSVIAQLKSASPDALLIIDTLPDVSSFLKQCVQLGYSPKIVITQFAAATPSFISTLGTLANGAASWFVWYPDYPTSFTSNFTKLFHAEWGYTPFYREAYEADSVFFASEAMARIIGQGQAITSNNLKNEIHTLYSAGTVTGTRWMDFLTGPMQIDQYGACTICQLVEYQVQNGTWVSVFATIPGLEGVIVGEGHHSIYPVTLGS